MGHRVLSWVATLFFLPVFAIILLVFDVAQRVANLFGQRAQEHVAGVLQWTLLQAFRICGVTFTVERAPEVERWTSYIIISNHQSMFDIVLLGSVLYSNFPKYVSKDSLARRIPSISYNLRNGGHVLIDRGDPESAEAGIRELGRRVRTDRCSGLIFPEGTRARTGDLKPFKPRGTLALLEEAPQTPVVTVAIDESWRVMRHNYFPVPFGVHVRIRIAAPIARTAGEDRRALIDLVHADIAATLERWRDGSGHARAA